MKIHMARDHLFMSFIDGIRNSRDFMTAIVLPLTHLSYSPLLLLKTKSRLDKETMTKHAMGGGKSPAVAASIQAMGLVAAAPAAAVAASVTAPAPPVPAAPAPAAPSLAAIASAGLAITNPVRIVPVPIASIAPEATTKK